MANEIVSMMVATAVVMACGVAFLLVSVLSAMFAMTNSISR